MGTMDTSPEDIADWLATETGHEAEEGYGEEDTEKEGEIGPRRLGLPQDKHEKMRRFFDGLHVEKALAEKRRNEPLQMMDEAEQMNEALKKATPEAGGY